MPEDCLRNALNLHELFHLCPEGCSRGSTCAGSGGTCLIVGDLGMEAVDPSPTPAAVEPAPPAQACGFAVASETC